MTNTEKPIRKAGFGATGFHPNLDRMPPLPDSLEDAQGWEDYAAAEQQQKSVLSEVDLAADARELIEDVANHWCYGVYAIQGLAALACEKHRRLCANRVPKPHEALAAWFSQLGLDPYKGYVPDANDCLALIKKNSPHAGDDGLGRPGFYDTDSN
jgi:hypothetical protein